MSIIAIAYYFDLVRDLDTQALDDCPVSSNASITTPNEDDCNITEQMDEAQNSFENFVESTIQLNDDSSEVGLRLKEILLEESRERKREKVKCKHCNEYITRSNMSRHIERAHIYCCYCKCIHASKTEQLLKICPLFVHFWQKAYSHH